jgi:hypothetical protein
LVLAGKYVKLLEKVAEHSHESAPDVHYEVNHKKSIDEELTKNLSLLVRIRCKIIVLLKCIVGLVCLVLFGIVYIVSEL